jgi:DNA-binding CsgD family transcriptional regulator
MKSPDIARQLDLAPTTVTYHLDRLRGGEDSARSPEPVAPAVSTSRTRETVARLLGEGVSRADIARTLGISKPSVSYHVRRLGEAIDERCARRYDWDAIQDYYERGHTVRECMRVFGFSPSSWTDAVKRGDILARPQATPIAELLVAGTYRGRHNLKLRLVKEGLKAGSCERCGLIAWRGQAITMALHHINGDRLDNRLENLELLCPNCHSQTEQYAGRNGRNAA